MSVFQYPKSKHTRALSPRMFKRYRSYKRYLQTEFSRACVYCRQPDSSAPNLNFGVDHYRPKGLPKFASLLNDYDNLYYCCGNCNSRKNDYWPTDESLGPYVINPCEHQMASHLWLDAKTGRVDPKSPNGRCTEELLQLNDEATVKYRLNTIVLVRMLEREIMQNKKQLKALTKRVKVGMLSAASCAQEIVSIEAAIASLVDIVGSQTGALVLPPLPRKRNGLKLV